MDTGVEAGCTAGVRWLGTAAVTRCGSGAGRSASARPSATPTPSDTTMTAGISSARRSRANLETEARARDAARDRLPEAAGAGASDVLNGAVETVDGEGGDDEAEVDDVGSRRTLGSRTVGGSSDGGGAVKRTEPGPSSM